MKSQMDTLAALPGDIPMPSVRAVVMAGGGGEGCRVGRLPDLRDACRRASDT